VNLCDTRTRSALLSRDDLCLEHLSSQLKGHFLRSHADHQRRSSTDPGLVPDSSGCQLVIKGRTELFHPVVVGPSDEIAEVGSTIPGAQMLGAPEYHVPIELDVTGILGPVLPLSSLWVM
jgi:hypothetical protein